MKLIEIQKVTKTLKLLYVEDDKFAQEATLELLKNFFSDIVVCSDGEDGLRQFKEHTFDIILSDINIPKLTGIQMIQEIRKTDNDISVIFLTAYNETSFLTQGIILNVDGYLLKPFHLNSFIRLLDKIVQKISLQRQNETYQTNLELEVKRQTKALNYKLHHDELTSLYNRYTFMEDLKEKKQAIISIIDINKFKIINEIYGTSVGSIVLQSFSKFLLEFTKDTTYVIYRISGDEFAILDNKENRNIDQIEKDVLKLLNKLKEFKVALDNDTISIEITIGISASNINTFEYAKIALEYAKLHKKQYKIYTSEINKREEEHDALLWKEKTKSAIEDNRIVPVYQPIINKSGTIIKYETLMRLYDDKTDRLITPIYFLDNAIKTGLYHQLSSYMIFNTLNLLKKSHHTLSLNFNYADILHDNLLKELENFFILNKDVGQRVIFEILESENIADYSILKKFIKKFRTFGIKFAIDDFGSGYSSFEHILEIEPDFLKIDGSLIKNIDTDKKAYILIEAIIEFSHKLGIKIIAEYVHSKIIFDMLVELNVDEFQGFYISEPVEIIL